MLATLLPRTVDNRLPGHRGAILLFVPALLLKAVIAVRSIVSAEDVARHADNLPLDNYGADGAQTVVAMFASLGWANLIFIAFSLLVLLRYRALLPLVALFHVAAALGSRYLLPLVAPAVHPPLPLAVSGIVLLIPGLFLAAAIVDGWPRLTAA